MPVSDNQQTSIYEKVLEDDALEKLLDRREVAREAKSKAEGGDYNDLYEFAKTGEPSHWSASRLERATHAEKELDDMRVDWDRKSDELREAHEQTARMVQQLQDVLGGGHTAVYDLANDIRDLIDQWGEPWHRETTWLVERGQPEGLLRAEWLKAGCGWTAEWTQDALLAQRFPFKAIAVDSIQHYGLKARPVLHGFLAPESSQPATPEGSHDEI